MSRSQAMRCLSVSLMPFAARSAMEYPRFLSLLADPAFRSGEKSLNILLVLDPGNDRHDGKGHGNSVIPCKPLYN